MPLQQHSSNCDWLMDVITRRLSIKQCDDDVAMPAAVSCCNIVPPLARLSSTSWQTVYTRRLYARGWQCVTWPTFDCQDKYTQSSFVCHTHLPLAPSVLCQYSCQHTYWWRWTCATATVSHSIFNSLILRHVNSRLVYRCIGYYFRLVFCSNIIFKRAYINKHSTVVTFSYTNMARRQYSCLLLVTNSSVNLIRCGYHWMIAVANTAANCF